MRSLRVAVLCLVATAAEAKVAPTSLQSLTLGATSIVIGRVDEVVEVEGKRFALLSVEEALEGPGVARMVLGFPPRFRCDITGFALHERTLFFLVPHQVPAERLAALGVEQVYAVAHHGRGGMPVRSLDGVLYVSPFGDVEVPPDLPTVPGPDPRATGRQRSVPLAPLREFIHRSGPKPVRTPR